MHNFGVVMILCVLKETGFFKVRLQNMMLFSIFSLFFKFWIKNIIFL